MTKFFDHRFICFLAASHNVQVRDEIPLQQRRALEEAFYAGACAGFDQGVGRRGKSAFDARAELNAFGTEIVERYSEAGLPLGQRRS